MPKTTTSQLTMADIRAHISRLASSYRDKNIALVAGVATGGIIPGFLLAEALGCRYVTIRPNRPIPADILAIRPVLFIDDIIDTGATKDALFHNYTDTAGVYFDTLYQSNPVAWYLFPWESNQDKMNSRQTVYE